MTSSSTDLSSLQVSELSVVGLVGQSVRPQHLMTLLVAHHLIVGFVQGDPHLYVGAEFSVTKSSVVCKRLRSLPEGKKK